MDEFEKFLHKIRKSNGDKLLPITIEKYAYFVNAYHRQFSEVNDDIPALIAVMNKYISMRPSPVIHSAFRTYLYFLGVPKDDPVLAHLAAPAKTPTSFNSKRFLQSKVLSRGELKRLFNEVEDDELKLIFSFLYDTACRRSELLGMKFGDMRFKHSEGENVYAEITVLGKGAKSRTVYIGKTSFELLQKLRPCQDKDLRVFTFRKKNGEEYKKQDDRLYSLIVNSIKDVLGRHITPHCFRHTKLTHLADNGADALGISSYAGHEDISTSQIYIEISSRIGRITYAQYSKDIVGED